MSILIINPPNKPFTNKGILAEPIDVLQIATILSAKFNLKVIDMDIDRMENDISDYLEERNNIVIFVYDYQIPLHTNQAINNIYEIINKNKKETKYIMISKTNCIKYNEYLENGIDVVPIGMVEDSIVEIIENINNFQKLKEINNLYIKDTNNIAYKTNFIKQKNNYSELLIPNRDFLDISKYIKTRTIISSRGCINHCNYCPTPYFFGTWNGKNANEIFTEIKYLINNYKTEQIIFLDDNALVNKSRIIELCNKIIDEKILVKLGCLSDSNFYDKELFQLMYKAGFKWIHFGAEAGNDELIKKMNKNIKVEQTVKAINESKEIGFRVRCSLILDYPGSSKNDVVDILTLIKKTLPQELRLHFFTYRIGTPIYDENQNQNQYIHSGKSISNDKELLNQINELINSLSDYGYEVVKDEPDWSKYDNLNKDYKIATLTPLKYGLGWN